MNKMHNKRETTNIVEHLSRLTSHAICLDRYFDVERMCGLAHIPLL